jgi:hypothetical protein
MSPAMMDTVSVAANATGDLETMEPVRQADASDAEVIRVCAEHIVNVAAYNSGDIAAEFENDPLWLAYRRTCDAICEAKPQTMAAVLAKARAAKADAAQMDGSEAPADGPAARWAWDLVNDLIRLDETPSPDAELIAACNEYLRIQRAFEVAYDEHDGDMEPGHPALDILDPIPALTEQIVALRATTAEGIAARMQCAAFHYLPSHHACQDDPDAGSDDRFEAAVLRDMVAMERGGR